MEIKFKTITRQEFFITLEDEEAVVSDLKKLLEEKRGSEFPADSTRLICAGRVLKDDENVIKAYKPGANAFIVAMCTKKPEKKEPEKPKEEEKESSSSSAAQPAAAQPAAEPASNPEFEAKVKNLMDMGYAREQVEQALRASFMNVERAVQYLIEGIPENAVAAAAAAEDVGDEGEEGSLQDLINTPQFQQMRQLVQSNPSVLPQLLNQIGQTNPQLLEMITQNQEQFLSMLNQPLAGAAAATAQSGAPPAGGAPANPISQGPGGQVMVALTETEKQAVDRLKSMGFPEALVVQAFFACDKDENAAANFLITQTEEMFDEGGAQ